MTVEPEQEAPHPPSGRGFSEAVTVAFGDPAARLFGVARLGLAEGGASGLVILFADGEPVSVRAEGGAQAQAPGSWEEVSAAGIDTKVLEPLRAWRLQYAGEDAALDLELEATGPIAELAAGHPVARAGGMTGYEQPVRVRGSATVGATRTPIDGLGQRGHSWGAPDWDRISVARTVSAWLGDDLAVSLTAVRPAGKRDHAAEAIAATILALDDADRPAALDVADPRLSTTYDNEGRQRHAGLELWVDEDGYPRRATGDVVCGTSLDLGRLRLDCAFFAWRMEGRHGFGRYDVLRRVD